MLNGSPVRSNNVDSNWRVLFLSALPRAPRLESLHSPKNELRNLMTLLLLNISVLTIKRRHAVKNT
ncbi:MAG: hypothetical protein K0Q74_1681 [Gammaproteobacteria bacterium]|nr:hypothetical protein [Gammaproteobacteria bacterium]